MMIVAGVFCIVYMIVVVVVFQDWAQDQLADLSSAFCSSLIKMYIIILIREFFITNIFRPSVYNVKIM